MRGHGRWNTRLNNFKFTSCLRIGPDNALVLIECGANVPDPSGNEVHIYTKKMGDVKGTVRSDLPCLLTCAAPQTPNTPTNRLTDTRGNSKYTTRGDL